MVQYKVMKNVTIACSGLLLSFIALFMYFTRPDPMSNVIWIPTAILGVLMFGKGVSHFRREKLGALSTTIIGVAVGLIVVWLLLLWFLSNAFN